MSEGDLRSWTIAGIVALLVVVAAIPLYVMREVQREEPVQALPAQSTFVGRGQCIECHTEAYEKWLGSDHDNAMDVASEETVLGDFDDWLTILVTHEHAHILHLDNIGGLPRIVNHIFGKIWAPNCA